MKMMITRLMAVALVGGAGLAAAQDNDRYEGESRDAWLAGKVETVLMLNRRLDAFNIDTEVTDGIVRLTGSVESEIDRELASDLAEGVEGVDDVENELTVESEQTRVASRDTDADDDGGERTFSTWVDDATTTAMVKSRLVVNDETQGLEIDVDTNRNVVTLSGRVQSEHEKELAQQVAMNVEDVQDVRNLLVVDPE